MGLKRRTSRREFVRTTGVGGIAAGVLWSSPSTFAAAKGSRPLVVASANGLRATEKAMEMIRAGADTLDAVIAGVNIIENDPNDMSVGFGGIPNENGEVELDASVMHGPTRRAGAVGALKNIKNPSKVAKVVMERTDHVMLVGEGALRFALAHGFMKEDLLTEASRAVWLKWKESMSSKDSWGPGLSAPDADNEHQSFYDGPLDKAEIEALSSWIIANPPTGTINCLAVNERGDISGTTTTSGLAFKMAGRVGDSPLIGSGLFVDNEVGAAGSTGRGEENIKIAGAHTVVEMMRRGLSPTEACLEACKRVAASYKGDLKKLRKFNIDFYALNKGGEYGAAALFGFSKSRSGELRRTRYAVNDGNENKLRDVAYLYESPDR